MNDTLSLFDFLVFCFVYHDYSNEALIDMLNGAADSFVTLDPNRVKTVAIKDRIKKDLILWNYASRERRIYKKENDCDMVPMYQPAAEQKVISIITAYLYK